MLKIIDKWPVFLHRLPAMVLALAACFIYPARAHQTTDYSLVPADRWDLKEAFPLDWDGDGLDEILHLNNFGNATIWGQGGNCCWSYTFGQDPDDSWFYQRQFYYRPSDRIFMLSHRRGDSIVMHIRDGKRQRNLLLDVRPKAVGRPDPGGSGYFLFPTLICPEGGPKVIVGYWITNFTTSHPRGLASYDYQTGKEMWHYWVGGNISDEPCFYDVNGDGRNEIMVCTGAAANGGRANGTDDGHTYIFCFNLSGKMIWKREVGGYFSNLSIRLIDWAGDKAILCWEVSHRDRENMGRPDAIYLFRPADCRLIKKVAVAEYLRPGVLGDIDNDDQEELVVGGSDGRIRIYSTDLELKGEYLNPTGNPIGVSAVADLDGDGYREVVAVDRNGSLVILNHNMETLLVQQAETISEKVKIVNSGKSKQILMATSLNNQRIWALWKFQPKPVYTRSNFAAYLAAAFLAMTLAALALFLFARRRALKLEQAMEQLNYPGLVLLSRKGKIVAINHQASVMLGVDAASSRGRRLLEIVPVDSLNQWQKILGQNESGKACRLTIGETDQPINLEVRQIFGANRRALIIEDITERENIQRSREWATVAQQMAHGIKTPLTTILLAVQKIGRESGKTGDGQAIAELCQTIEEEISRLRKSSDGLMRFLNLSQPNREEVDIGGFIENIAGKYGLGRENGLELALDISPGLPPVLLDKKLMEIAIDNLIENAVAAVGNRGRVTIEVLLSEKFYGDFRPGKAIKIEISDNGPGIALAYKRKLFTPFFTTKDNGTGLGLMMTKRIIEDHGGQIEIESREKIGTVVTIYLPIAERNGK